MKNFKFLLATTAILSTALTVNVEATNPTADMNASIEIISVAEFTVTQDLDFGRWAFSEESPQGTHTFSMDNTGNVTYTGDSEDTPTRVTNGTRGVVEGMPCDILSFPEKHYIITVGDDSIFLTGLHAVETAEHTCAVYADNLEFDDDDDNGIVAQKYSGTFTITAVLQ